MAAAQPGRVPPLRRHIEHPRGGPTVLRIILGTQLRRLRESVGVSREEAADAIRGSHAKICRLELGRVGCKERDVADLLTLYRVTDEERRAAFLALARGTSTPGWWHRYNDVLPGWFETLIGLEEAASVIRTYEVQFIPGLLQTAEYARAVCRLGDRTRPLRRSNAGWNCGCSARHCSPPRTRPGCGPCSTKRACGVHSAGPASWWPSCATCWR